MANTSFKPPIPKSFGGSSDGIVGPVVEQILEANLQIAFLVSVSIRTMKVPEMTKMIFKGNQHKIRACKKYSYMACYCYRATRHPLDFSSR